MAAGSFKLASNWTFTFNVLAALSSLQPLPARARPTAAALRSPNGRSTHR
jgi:hypothetical protein